MPRRTPCHDLRFSLAHDLQVHVSPDEALEVRALDERPVDTGRRDLQRVGPADRVLGVENLADPPVRRRDRIEIQAIFAVQQNPDDRSVLALRPARRRRVRSRWLSRSRLKQRSEALDEVGLGHCRSPPCPQNKRSERKPTSRKTACFTCGWILAQAEGRAKPHERTEYAARSAACVDWIGDRELVREPCPLGFDERSDVRDRIGERHGRALARRAHLELETPSARPFLPTTTWNGQPMRSASLNFTPARSSRSSMTVSTPAAASSLQIALGDVGDLAFGHERQHRDLERGDSDGPDDAALVVVLLDDGGQRAAHADAIAAHQERAARRRLRRCTSRSWTPSTSCRAGRPG